jgi:hypothetical protein
VYERVELHLLDSGQRLVAARELDDVGDQRAELLGLGADVLQQPAPVVGGQLAAREQHLDVRAQRRDRRAQLVRRVGDELALRVGGVVERTARPLERVEHRVEARRHPPDLVVAGDLDAPAEILGLGDVLRGGCELRHGLDDLAAEQPAEQRRQQRRAGAQQREQDPQARQRAVDVGEAAGELDRPLVLRPDGQHAQVHAVDVGVAQQRLLLPGRDRSVAVVDRNAQVAARGDQDLARHVDHLHRPRRSSGPRGGGGEALPGLEQAPGLAHLLVLRGERVVDLAAQLAAQRDVRDDRDEHDRDPDRARGEDRQAVAQRHHGSRRT